MRLVRGEYHKEGVPTGVTPDTELQAMVDTMKRIYYEEQKSELLSKQGIEVIQEGKQAEREDLFPAEYRFIESKVEGIHLFEANVLLLEEAYQEVQGS